MNIAIGSQTMVRKVGDEAAMADRPRACFLPNAGLRLANVTKEDSGKYQCTVVFPGGKTLVDEANLVVVEGKLIFAV